METYFHESIVLNESKEVSSNNQKWDIAVMVGSHFPHVNFLPWVFNEDDLTGKGSNEEMKKVEKFRH